MKGNGRAKNGEEGKSKMKTYKYKKGSEKKRVVSASIYEFAGPGSIRYYLTKHSNSVTG